MAFAPHHCDSAQRFDVAGATCFTRSAFGLVSKFYWCSIFLQENVKWQEKDGKLIAMTDNVDYDIEGM